MNGFRPLCPVVLFEGKGEDQVAQVYTIHCQQLKVDVECYVSTAIISMQGRWTNQTDKTLDCVFALPTSGTIMSVALSIGKERLLRTAIVSNKDKDELLRENQKKKKGLEVVPESANPYEQYIPDLFRLPFGGVQPGEQIQLDCQYLQTLEYYKKGYGLLIPLYFSKGTIAEDAKWDDIVSVTCKIDALSSDTKVHVFSHEVTQEQSEYGSIVVKTVKCKEVDKNKQNDHPLYTSEDPLSSTGRDFELYYNIKSDTVTAHAIRKTERNEDGSDTNSLCLFVTPPASLKVTFGRAFFFLLDRSGSMAGEPFQEATRALFHSLDRLRQSDKFAICSFDHRQVYFKQSLVTATEPNINSAKSWIQQNGPDRGGTVMDVPIQKAMDVLDGSDLLPFIVLITDGAVQNEKEICKELEERRERAAKEEDKEQEQEGKKSKTRILTLGIGSFCNWFFLKMLSKLGRGFSDVVVYREKIYSKMDHLLKMANTPVLTDIEIAFLGNDIELYPFPIPDLFINAPLVITSQYRVQQKHPKNMVIRGFEASGEKKEVIANIQEANHLPVDKIFVKEKIDLLTAQAWFSDDRKIESQVVQASVEHSIPSQYTSLIAFETRQEDLLRRGLLADENKDEKNDDESGFRYSKIKPKNWAIIRNNKTTVGALALGGTAIVIAATAASFGDVQATFDNVPVLDSGLDLDADDACCGCELDCCDCCEAAGCQIM